MQVIAMPESVGATITPLVPGTVSWAEPAFAGRTLRRQLRLDDVGGRWPGVSSYQQGTILDRSDWLDPSQVAGLVDAREAVDALRASYAALRPHDLPAPTAATGPVRGTLRFESPFVDAGIAARFVTVPLRGAPERIVRFVDAARQLVEVVQRHSGRS